ncbi:hypothetical protein D8B22_10340 [Verminephrobacter aporrectodeae subsp. tuberculatae]|uniref:hypothetical protein n=1 Tax=Verminephrobacter aporrectodeae TaxID=1110389 RepID=UPI0002376C58|nr:hypothetical protein [Verminephrobacter aporrectodeae]MCW8165400.1 hypothetical protein [Verminephrobacter aporrectodeae subsp. tuberculatae]MCW8169492.1 hypothetical protein [Verminephrobacter aporrectodeae subsp. tuberculatae]
MNDLNASNVQADAQPDSPASAQPPVPQPTHLPLWVWMREGLRTMLFLPPRIADARPTVWQLAVLFLLGKALVLAAEWLHMANPVRFDLHGWLSPAWSGVLLLCLAWWAMAPARNGPVHSPETPTLSSGMLAWYALWTWAPLVPTLLYALGLVRWWYGNENEIVFWATCGVFTVWMFVALVLMSTRFIRSFGRAVIFALALAAVIGVNIWQFWHSPWSPNYWATAEACVQSGDSGNPGMALVALLSTDRPLPGLAQ